MAYWRVHRDDTKAWAVQAGFTERQAKLIAEANVDIDRRHPPLRRVRDLPGLLKLLYQWPVALYNTGRHFNIHEAYPWFWLRLTSADSRLTWSRRYRTMATREFEKQAAGPSEVPDQACRYLGYALHGRQDMFFHRRLIGHQPWWDDERDPRNAERWSRAREDTLEFLKSWREELGLMVKQL
jgi:hypothetical protein